MIKYLSIIILFSTLYSWSQTLVQDDPARDFEGQYPIIVLGQDGAASRVIHGLEWDRNLQSYSENPFAEYQIWGWANQKSSQNWTIADPMASWGAFAAQSDHMALRTTQPHLQATYYKSDFDGIFFQLDFQRNLWGPFTFGLWTQSNRKDTTGTWEYQSTVHQAYLSMKRDSITLPLNGRNLFQDHFGWSPWIALDFGSAFYAQVSYISWAMSADLPWEENPTVDPSDPKLIRTFLHLPWHQDENTSTLDFNFHGLQNAFTWNLRQQIGSAQQNSQALPTYTLIQGGDSLYSPISTIDSINVWQTHFELSSIFNSPWKFSILGENRWTDLAIDTNSPSPLGHNVQEDRQRLWTKIQWIQDSLQTAIEIGSGRASLANNTRSIYPMASANLNWHGNNWQGIAQWSYQNQMPTTQQLTRFNLAWPNFPNPNLVPSQRNDFQLDCSYFHWIWWDASIYGSEVNQAIVPSNLYKMNIYALNSTFTNALDSNMSWTNAQEEDRLVAKFGIRAQYGHWQTEIHREQFVINQVQDIHGVYSRMDLPNVLWLGSLLWRDTLLNKKSLDLQLKWNWQMIGAHSYWNPDLNTGDVTLLQAPDQFMFDFEARVWVRSFQIFTQLRNISHEYLYSMPGFTSPGIHLQWGLTWAFED